MIDICAKVDVASRYSTYEPLTRDITTKWGTEITADVDFDVSLVINAYAKLLNEILTS